MDMREASAMTEASGLVNDVNDQDGAVRGSETMPGAERGRNSRPLQSHSRNSALRLAEQLRKVTLKAPLQSLLAAFLLGVCSAALDEARLHCRGSSRHLILVGSVTLNGAGAIPGPVATSSRRCSNNRTGGQRPVSP